MESLKAQFLDLSYSFSTSDFNNSSAVPDFHLFADDSDLFFSTANSQTLETMINNELCNINAWLCANKLSLNVEKTNFVIFHPPQKKLSGSFNITINDKTIKQFTYIKYLGVFLVCSSAMFVYNLIINPYPAKEELTRFRYHVSHCQRRVYSFLKYAHTLTLKTRAYVHVLT